MATEQVTDASAKADRAATPSEPSPAVSGKAGIPCASRKWPTGLPLVDQLRSCMLKSVPQGQAAGMVSSLPYDAAEQIHDLHDALARIVSDRGEYGDDSNLAPADEQDRDIATAMRVLARVRGEQVSA